MTTAKPTRTTHLNAEVQAYVTALEPADRDIGTKLAREIAAALPDGENKIWHAHPVWFLDGNPIVGFSKVKESVRLMFWSGHSFDEAGLSNEGKFKAAVVRYTDVSQITAEDLRRWLRKAREIQWDYKNIVKREGRLERLL